MESVNSPYEFRFIGEVSRRQHTKKGVEYGKRSFDLTKITDREYEGLSILCASTLAYAHAKTGDRHAFAGYLGKKEAFEHAMVQYAYAYAEQNEADYETFRKLPSNAIV